jgi:hypothetical protein
MTKLLLSEALEFDGLTDDFLLVLETIRFSDSLGKTEEAFKSIMAAYLKAKQDAEESYFTELFDKCTGQAAINF